MAHADLAFESVEHIMRDVNYGWLIGMCMQMGHLCFLAVLYSHI